MAELTFYTGIWDFTAEDLINKIKSVEDSEDLTIRLNSPGGSVFAGWGISAALSERAGKTKIIVEGAAASMAFMMTLFADEVEALDVTSFMVHRATMFIESEDDKKLLNNVNLKIREKIEKKFNKKVFQEITGVSLKDVFEGEKRRDVWITAKEAKKIGLVNKVIRLEPKNPQDYCNQLIAFKDLQGGESDSQGSEKQDNINVEQKIKEMTKEEFKAQNPELYSEIYEAGKAAGVGQEKDRIEAYLEFVEVDADSVKKQITDGNQITNKFMAEMTKKMMVSAQKEEIKDDSKEIKNQDPPKEEKTAAQVEAESFEKDVYSAMNLKEEAKS